MNTWCSTARGITACCRTRSWRGAASRCSRSARPCTPPACGSATAWRRRRSRASCARCISSTPSASPTRCSTPIAAYLDAQPRCGEALAAFFQAKRDRLRAALAHSGFSLPPAQGTYFQLLDYGAFAHGDDLAFAERLLTEARVATIPLSPFYAQPPRLTFLRLCIAKRDATLDEAAARLNDFATRLGRAGA